MAGQSSTTIDVMGEINTYRSQIAALKSTLSLKLEQSVESPSPDQSYVQKWNELAERYVLAPALALDNVIDGTRSDTSDLANAHVDLEVLNNQYREVVALIPLIEQSMTAEKKADQTRETSTMYFKMRKRQTQLPAKTLKAYGVMSLAKNLRDQGDFVKALKLWAQAEAMVEDSINELIAIQSKWLAEAKRDANASRVIIKAKVEVILKDYFVDIPKGSFDMGSLDGSAEALPVHLVSIDAFKLAKAEVTFELWDLCVEYTSCFNVPKDYGWGRVLKPVGDISYKDIVHRFIPWLNDLTGKKYRLPTEAEWEYAARAGSGDAYSWGANILCSMARYNGGRDSICNANDKANKGPVDVKSYPPNAFGLYDMHGNTWEWVQDCWNPNYEGAPADGSAWLTASCEQNVLRGGSWAYPKSSLRSSSRHFAAYNMRRPSYGFRLVLDE